MNNHPDAKAGRSSEFETIPRVKMERAGRERRYHFCDGVKG